MLKCFLAFNDIYQYGDITIYSDCLDQVLYTVLTGNNDIILTNTKK